MKITQSKCSGFCPGVKKAHLFLEKLIKQKNFDRIFTLGELIHNRLYNENLKSLGVYPITFSELKKITGSSKEKIALIIRTHGITKEESEALTKLKKECASLEIFDMTCHHVKSAQKIARKSTTKTDM